MTHTHGMASSCALAETCARFEDDAGKYAVMKLIPYNSVEGGDGFRRPGRERAAGSQGRGRRPVLPHPASRPRMRTAGRHGFGQSMG